MSLFLDIADAMARHIEASIPKEELAVVVDRQKDLSAELAKHLGKVSGGVLIIEFLGASSNDLDAYPPNMSASYQLTLWAKPVLRKGKTSALGLVETICRLLHHWRGEDYHCYSDLFIESCNLVASREALIYAIKAKKTINI